jgi:hypothetical protein
MREFTITLWRRSCRPSTAPRVRTCARGLRAGDPWCPGPESTCRREKRQRGNRYHHAYHRVRGGSRAHRMTSIAARCIARCRCEPDPCGRCARPRIRPVETRGTSGGIRGPTQRVERASGPPARSGRGGGATTSLCPAGANPHPIMPYGTTSTPPGPV